MIDPLGAKKKPQQMPKRQEKEPEVVSKVADVCDECTENLAILAQDIEKLAEDKQSLPPRPPSYEVA